MGFAHGRASVGNRWRWRRRAELADGRFTHESCNRIAYRSRGRNIRIGVGGRHGVTPYRAAIHVGGGGRCADLDTDGADRIDVVGAVRRFRGGDRGRMRIRLRIESGTHRKTCGHTRRAFAVCGVGGMVRRFGGARVRQAYYAERDAGAAGAVVDERRDVDTG